MFFFILPKPEITLRISHSPALRHFGHIHIGPGKDNFLAKPSSLVGP